MRKSYFAKAIINHEGFKFQQQDTSPMNIIGRTAELETFSAILKNWKRDSPLWVHIQGEPGIGKSHLIQFLYEGNLKNYDLVYRFNYRLLPLGTILQIRDMFHYINKNFPDHLAAFLKRYPGYLKAALLQLFEEGFSPDKIRTVSVHFLSELLVRLLQFLSTRGKPLLILENICFEDDSHTDILFELLEADAALPILILSSGVEEPPERLQATNVHLIRLKKLSALEIQKFIQNHFAIREENARFIANHLQIKSQGIPRKIKFLLEAFYRPVLPSESEKFIDPQRLHKLRISPVPDVIFGNLLHRLSEIEIAVFSFLSRLTDPMPLSMLHDILKELGASKDSVSEWIEKDYLCKEHFSGQKYVAISWDEWKSFLKQSVPIKEVTHILRLLNTGLSAQHDKKQLHNLQYPFQLSHLYFEAGDKNFALRLAHREALMLKEMGFHQRAYERYNFLKRNLGHSEDTKAQETILREIGQLQKSRGLQENAFESFRELRDRFGKSDRKIWFYASLQMAEILLQMDAFAEARYLLNDLKIKKTADSFTKSFSYMLLGDLDRNMGHHDYAVAKYQQALTFIDGVEDAEFIYQLYSKIRALHLRRNDEEGIQSLIQRVEHSSVRGTRFEVLIQFDRLKLLLDRKDFASAIQLALQIYGQTRRRFDPGLMTQSVLYLVDIYALLSKWYLARSHLHRILQMRLFTTHPKIEVRMLINLAVIEKEIAHYGKALKLLSEAETICRRENYPSQVNEIKIHKGHIQLLIHGYVRQREYLTEALRWSMANQDQELFVMASLYLSSYEIQQKRFGEAKQHLWEARRQINLTSGEIDKLNYTFYLLRYLLAAKKLRWAERVLQIWEERSRGISKFENLAIWLKAKLYYQQGDYRTALKSYQVGLQRSRKYRLPHLEVHILKEIVVLCDQAGLKKEFGKFVPQLKAAYKNLCDAIEDEILRKQFYESREVIEIIQMGIDLN